MREVGARDAPFDFAPLRSGRTEINGSKKAGEEKPFVAEPFDKLRLNGGR